jgi:hypothetical protein
MALSAQRGTVVSPTDAVLHGLRKAAARRLAEADALKRKLLPSLATQPSRKWRATPMQLAARSWNRCQAHRTKAGQKFPTLEIRVGENVKKMNLFIANLC